MGRRYCDFCRKLCPKCQTRTKWKRSSWCFDCTQVYLAEYKAREKMRVSA